jgi:hypothetical protein
MRDWGAAVMRRWDDNPLKLPRLQLVTQGLFPLLRYRPGRLFGCFQPSEQSSGPRQIS